MGSVPLLTLVTQEQLLVNYGVFRKIFLQRLSRLPCGASDADEVKR